MRYFQKGYFSRFATVRLRYATKLHPPWEFGRFAVADPARPLKLNGYPSSPLIRNLVMSASRPIDPGVIMRWE